MITLTDEQAQQIEEALHRGVKDLEPFDRWKEQLDAIAILREALATIRAAIAEQQTERTQDAERNVVGLAEKAEQEPVAYISRGGLEELKAEGRTEIFAERDYECAETLPLYASPVRTKDLTDDEIDRIACNVSHKEFARAVIAADREKNK